MKTKQRAKYQNWTKDEVRKLLTLWDKHTIEELEEKMGRGKNTLTAMAKKLRDVGFEVARKRRAHYTHTLLLELAEDMGIKVKAKK